MSYSENNDHLEAAKEFLRKYGKTIIIAFIIFLAAFYGWRYWQQHQNKSLAAVSEQYEKLVKNVDITKPESVQELTEFNQKTNNIYAVLGAMKLAQLYVDTDDYDNALQQIEFAKNKNKDVELDAVLNMRLARLQLQQKKFDQAMASLAKVTSPSWQPQVADIEGDLFTAEENYDEAIATYEQALASSVMTTEKKRIMKMKLNNLQYLKALKVQKEQKNSTPEMTQPQKASTKNESDEVVTQSDESQSQTTITETPSNTSLTEKNQ